MSTSSRVVARFAPLDARAVRTLLLDADGNLVGSEEPAFVASTEVLNRLAAALGTPRRYEAEELRLATLGKNFRTVASELAADLGTPLEPEELERWIAEEKRAVTLHLREALAPRADVTGSLERLAERFELAVVSSSALSRLDACFDVAGLAGLLPVERRFSAEDSLPRPTSKPDPAVYLHAAAELGVPVEEAVAVEDSVTGARSAVAAGIPTIGNVLFVADAEREGRVADLREAGVAAVVEDWTGVEELLAG